MGNAVLLDGESRDLGRRGYDRYISERADLLPPGVDDRDGREARIHPDRAHPDHLAIEGKDACQLLALTRRHGPPHHALWPARPLPLEGGDAPTVEWVLLQNVMYERLQQEEPAGIKRWLEARRLGGGALRQSVGELVLLEVLVAGHLVEARLRRPQPQQPVEHAYHARLARLVGWRWPPPHAAVRATLGRLGQLVDQPQRVHRVREDREVLASWMVHHGAEERDELDKVGFGARGTRCKAAMEVQRVAIRVEHCDAALATLEHGAVTEGLQLATLGRE